MQLLDAIILGIIQGLAEFFPISSSAHLTIAKIFFHIQDDPTHFFDLICHMGTLFSALIFFRKEIKKTFQDPRMCLLFFCALLPLIPIYFFAKPIIYSLSNPKWLFFFLLISASFLLSASFMKEKERAHAHKFKDVLFIGVMQSMALVPGISRSGSTIAAGLFRGWHVQDAIRFSFLLAIPTVLGGTVLESIKVWNSPAPTLEFTTYFSGFLASFVCGLFSVRLIYWSLSKKRLRSFAIYLMILASICYFAI